MSRLPGREPDASFVSAPQSIALTVQRPTESAPPPITAPELFAIALAAVYLLGPWRVLFSDVAAFVLGWVVVRASGRALAPTPSSSATAPRVYLVIACFTALALAALLAYGRAHGVALRLDHLALTCALYVPFAWMQQEVTQRYLVVRLGRAVGGRSDLVTAAVGGLVFGLCHLPFPGLTAPTLVAGIAWGYAFLVTGRMLPIVLSHAVLGASYFLLVFDRDPFEVLRHLW